MDEPGLRIFKIDHSECNGNWEDCMSIKRLLAALKYYSVSDVHIFCDFVDRMYNVQLLDDYAHFIKEHDDDLYAINQRLGRNGAACSTATCSFSSRHHRQKERKTKIKNEKFGFYADTMDALHYHLLHLFECGMRVRENEKTEENDHPKTAYFDSAFSRMVQRVNKRRQNTQSFDRFKSVSKFNLDNDNDSKSNTTFLEEVNEKLQSRSFLEVVEDEEFETDSIKMDIMDAKANLFKILSNEKKINLIKEFIANIKLQKNTFSIGYRFFYWDQYKDMEKEVYDYRLRYYNKLETNIDDYGGYKVNELYVTKKHQDFKQGKY